MLCCARFNQPYHVCIGSNLYDKYSTVSSTRVSSGPQLKHHFLLHATATTA
eukprot:m.757080 g.757080  ORF g.757080 m.757080 type:complete len:51 (-) comp23187_c0_seq3:2297-2449(-)